MLEKGKKLLFICEYKSLYGGNFIPSLMALEKQMSTYGISCVYAFPKEAEQREWISFLKSEGKDIIFFDFKLPASSFISELSKLVKENQIRYVYSHFVSILKIELFAIEHREIKVFIHIHSDFSAGKMSFKNKIKNFLMYKVFAREVVFFSVSNAFVYYNPKKISYVPNGIATNRIGCEHMGGDAIRRKYGIEEEDILCEMFGWTPIVKGVDIAVNAVKYLNENTGKSMKLAIICGREMTIERMKDWVKKNTNCSGDEDYLLYWEPQEDVFSYHEAADMLLSASRSEGFPYSILEMLSIGKRCVVSDIPGVIWTKKYENVFPFITENIQECARALCEAIEYKNSINKDTINKINEEYSIDNWTNKIIKKINAN